MVLTEFTDDVVDAIRVLRAADALRQRGTNLRTSGGYEICIDAATGRAVYTLRSADGEHLFLLSCHDDKSAGEANVRVAAITARGDLRIAFHRGSFLDDAASAHAVRSAAHVISDIQADVLGSFAEAPANGDEARASRPAGSPSSSPTATTSGVRRGCGRAPSTPRRRAVSRSTSVSTNCVRSVTPTSTS